MRDFETGLTSERLKERIHYDPNTGKLTRKVSVGAAKAGSEVSYTFPCGYVGVRIDGFLYYAHRLAWLYVHGRWPASEIDHIDRCRTNNCLANLREALPAENSRNLSKAVNNTSGVTGVYWDGRNKRWAAQIQLDGQNIHLGRHRKRDDAIAARKLGEEKYFGSFRRAALCLLLGLALCSGLSSPAKATTCVASFYGVGDGYGGRKTASGERMNPHAMTAAHRTLPFGTILHVTYRGRTVAVRVNDRGPFVRGRCVDLSYAAAKAIGLPGVGAVTVR